MHRFSPRRLVAVAGGLCLVMFALVPAMAVGAQTYPYPYPGGVAAPALAPPVISGSTTTQAPVPVPAPAVQNPATLPAPAVPAAPITSSGYPPNAVISSYFDPRYCGDGAVSVVTDAGGALINICTSTGQRILPIYPDYAPVPYAPGVPAAAYGYNNGYYGNGATYGYTYGYTPNVANYGYVNGYANGYTNNIRQYTDNNSNCPNGAVSQTPSGFFCTANGLPAFTVR